jgi:hypothetical protein
MHASWVEQNWVRIITFRRSATTLFETSVLPTAWRWVSCLWLGSYDSSAIGRNYSLNLLQISVINKVGL